MLNLKEVALALEQESIKHTNINTNIPATKWTWNF